MKGTRIFGGRHYPRVTKMRRPIGKDIKEDDNTKGVDQEDIQEVQKTEAVPIEDNDIPSKGTQIKKFYDLAENTE